MLAQEQIKLKINEAKYLKNFNNYYNYTSETKELQSADLLLIFLVKSDTMPHI